MAQRQLPEKLTQTVAEFINRLKADKLPIDSVWIFGSYAKGKPHPWSDVDVCVVSPRFTDTWEALQYLWQKRNFDPQYTIEPIGFSPQEFADATSLTQEIKQHGIKLSV